MKCCEKKLKQIFAHFVEQKTRLVNNAPVQKKKTLKLRALLLQIICGFLLFYKKFFEFCQISDFFIYGTVIKLLFC